MSGYEPGSSVPSPGAPSGDCPTCGAASKHWCLYPAGTKLSARVFGDRTDHSYLSGRLCDGRELDPCQPFGPIYAERVEGTPVYGWTPIAERSGPSEPWGVYVLHTSGARVPPGPNRHHTYAAEFARLLAHFGR